jgi:hypothetical protein
MEKGKAREGEGKSVTGTFRNMGVTKDAKGVRQNFANSGSPLFPVIKPVDNVPQEAAESGNLKT